MDQGAMKGAIDGTSDGSESKQWIKMINRRKHGLESNERSDDTMKSDRS